MKKSKIFIITMLMFLVAMCIAPMTAFASTEIGKVEINAVKFNYNVGDKPESYAIRSGDTAYYYDIEYEYCEEMETNASGESVPVKYWYSDESKNNALAEDKKITTFEEGKTYMYSISLTSRDGYTFADNTEVYVNSEKVDARNIVKNERGIFITAIKTIKPTKPVQEKEIDVVEINNATLKFNDGDKPVFTGTTSDTRYKFVFEAWRTNDAGISSVDWFNNEDHLPYWGGKLITTFDKNKTYTYELALVTSATGSDEGWIFGSHTKLKINGQEVGYVYLSEDNPQSFDVKTKIAITPTSTKPEQPVKETVNEIQSTGETKAKIEFEKEVSKEYELDIKPVEIKKDLTDKNVKYVVDINVLENGQIVKISDTKMKIRIALPEDLKGFNKYEVVYILDDEIKETLPATVEDGDIVFETSHLSQYGIIATNVEEKTEQTENETNNPKTGDNMITIVMLFVASIATIGALTVINRKKVRE